ncbi:MAG: tetratricopeptide repeat-containing serine protease family protein, partial [Desulfobacca sp.]|nr:tetratricopeptide repeat-containing serine protease family protein [Desulfobacca sp.]
RYTVGQEAIPATLKAADPDQDLCRLAAPGLTAKPARVGKTQRLRVGERVYAVGASQGLELSRSEGMVSQVDAGPPPLIQTTAAFSPASSGGGLFNAAGELVGIINSYLKDNQGQNFALAVEGINAIAQRQTPKPGVEVSNQAPEISGSGVRIKVGWAKQALALEKAQDWQGLAAYCSRWIEAEPTNALPWGCLGLAYENLGRYRAKLAAYQEALRLKPDYAEAWYNLGVAYGKLGHYGQELATYQEALRLQPDDAAAWNNLGVAYVRMGRYRDAVAACREALRLKPDVPEAWNNLAFSYYLSGNYGAAQDAIQELRRYDPPRAAELENSLPRCIQERQ